MRLRIRFSLRTLLLSTVVVAGGCYYWWALPSIYAQRFVDAVTAGDYVKADVLFVDPADGFLVDWDTRYTIVKQRAKVEPTSLGERLRGERQVTVIIVYKTPTHTLSKIVKIVVTRSGLQRPQRQHSPVGMGGGLATISRIRQPSALPLPPCPA